MSGNRIGAAAAGETTYPSSSQKIPLSDSQYVQVSNLSKFVQRAEATAVVAASSTTAALPYDDTIPQSNEGVEVITVSITPKATANRLVIVAQIMAAANTATVTSVALFQDATASALRAVAHTGIADGIHPITLVHEMAAGTTSATTFKIRAGNATGATTYINRNSGGRKFGGVMACTLSVEEYRT
jgi:hypothetical protein